jgi:transcriptional regulator with XRE-family HTH domain
MDKAFSLGPRLRALRKERDLTQRDLAGQAGVSANAISLIERDEISPSVMTLQRLATALKVKMSYFFAEDDGEENVLHMKAGERPAITSKGVTIEAIGKRLREQRIEPFCVALEPHSESGRQQVVHSGHELVYCLRGAVEYEVDGQTYLLQEGDFLLFGAELPHHWRNPAAEKAEVLLILQTLNESYESVRRHFSSHPSLAHIG